MGHNHLTFCKPALSTLASFFDELLVDCGFPAVIKNHSPCHH